MSTTNPLMPLRDPAAPAYPFGTGGGGPDIAGRELRRRTALATLVAAGGVAAGVLSLLIAGPQGTLQWLGFLAVGLAVFFLLARHFEAGVVAFLGVCWIAVGTPALARGGSGGAQGLKLSQIGLVVLLALWAVRLLLTHRKRRETGEGLLYAAPVHLPILVYLVVSIWSTVNGVLFPNEHVLRAGPKQYVQVNVLEALLRVLALGGLLLVADTLRGRTLKIAAVVLLVPGLLTFTGLLSFLPASLYLAFPQILAMAVLTAIALTGGGWARPWMRALAAGLAIAILGFYFVKGAEWVSGWLGAFVAVGIITFNAKRKLFWGALAVIAVLVLLNAPYFYEKVYKSNFYGAGPTTDRTRIGKMGTFQNDRTRMLAASVRYANHFPLGIGLGNYRSYNQYFGRVDVWNTTTFTSAHGTYAQTLSETGWLGLGALLWLLFSCGRMLRRYWRHLPPGWAKSYVLGGYGGAVGIFVASFNGDYLFPTYHNGGMGSFGACVYVWLLIGLCIAIAREHGLKWAEIAEREPDRLSVRPVYRHGPHAELPAARPAASEARP